ncbi:MAG TPA: hypothetical protein VH700_16155 [Gemmatimonadales bacterium]|jgi:hypothetical protein
MQARHLAVSGDSVYILGPDDQLRYIVRAEEGLWGPWQEGGVPGQTIVHAGPVIGRLDQQGRVSALQRVPPLAWQVWEFRADELAAANLANGAPALFAVQAGELRYTWKASPSSAWGEWEPLGGPIRGVAPTLIPGGGLAAFGISGGDVRHRWQTRPSEEWREWADLGAPGVAVSALRAMGTDDGGLAIFGLGEDGVVYHRWQEKSSRPWGEWNELGGSAECFDVSRTPTGGLAILTVGFDREVRCRFQSRPSGEWSRWLNLRGEASRIALRPGYADGLEAFMIGLNGEVYHNWCRQPAEPWTGWRLLDREAPLAAV